MTKTVAVLQSNYLPWKGYFDIINDVDLFIFYDDVQFTKNDWRNRNRIKTANGTIWLTVPVGADIRRLICEVQTAGGGWAPKHWKTIQQSYSRAPYFSNYAPFLEDFYLGHDWTGLSDMNQHLIRVISRDFLGISAGFADSRQFSLGGASGERLLDLLQQAGATHYVSGPSARSYIEESRFADAGIGITFKSYEGYPEYPQSFPPFEHNVSIIDLLFHAGPAAADYIWGGRRRG